MSTTDRFEKPFLLQNKKFYFKHVKRPSLFKLKKQVFASSKNIKFLMGHFSRKLIFFLPKLCLVERYIDGSSSINRINGSLGHFVCSKETERIGP